MKISNWMKGALILIAISIIIPLVLPPVMVTGENTTVKEQEYPDEENKTEVMDLTLETVKQLVFSHSPAKLVEDAKMELNRTQLQIGGQANADLISLGDTFDYWMNSLGKKISAVRQEREAISSWDFNYYIFGPRLRTHYDTLKGGSYPYAAQVLTAIEEQSGGPEVVKNLSPSVLIDGLKEMEDKMGEEYFNIVSGENTTIKEVNKSLADLLGLKAERRLTITQATELIRLRSRQATRLLQYSGQALEHGFALMAEKVFYDLHEANLLLEVRNRAVERAAEQYAVAEKARAAGQLSLMDLQQVQIQWNILKMEASQAEVERKNAELAFRQATGLAEDVEFQLIIPEVEKVDVPLEDALKIAMDYRIDTLGAKQAVELAEKNLEYTGKRHNNERLEYKESKQLLDVKRQELELAEKEAERIVRNAYYQWQQAVEARELMAQNLNLMENQLEVAEKAFNMGYSLSKSTPLINLLQAQEQYAALEQGMVKAELSSNLAYLNYLQEVGYSQFLRYGKK